MNKANIKSIMASPGWDDIEKIIEEERDKPAEVNKSKSIEEIGKEALSRQMAREIINDIIKRLYSIKSEIDKKNISYK